MRFSTLARMGQFGDSRNIKCFPIEITGDYISSLHWLHQRFCRIDYPSKAGEDCPAVTVPLMPWKIKM